MHVSRFQFRLADLALATALAAGVLASVIYLPSTYRTHGAVGSFVASLPIVLAWFLGGVGFCFRRLRVPAVIVTLLVCGVFSFRQARLIERLRDLEAEVPRIVAYVESYQRAHEGECPADLSQYVFDRPELEPFIRYVPPASFDPRLRADAKPYAVRYHPVATADLSYWYTSTGGYWYDDD